MQYLNVCVLGLLIVIQQLCVLVALLVLLFLFVSVGGVQVKFQENLKVQLINEFGSIPKKLKLYNCVGGGSSSFGFWNEFMDLDKKQCEFIGVEAGGPAKSKKHAAPLTYGSKIGILHGAAQYVNQKLRWTNRRNRVYFCRTGLSRNFSTSLFLKRCRKGKIYCG